MDTSAMTAGADPAQVGLDGGRLAVVDAALDRYVDEGKLPGVVLLVARHGTIAHLHAYGRRSVEDDLPIDADTVFRIFSMTKPITSLAAMRLWERGEFELTDPVSRWLPEFAQPRVFTGGSNLRPVTVPATEPVRIWHLLTHTAGLTYGFHNAGPVDAIYRAHGYDWSAPRSKDLAGVVEDIAGLPLLFQPGAEWNYSMATDVVGRLVEVITGQPLDVALENLVLGPLGMSETAFRVPEGRRDRLAELYLPGPGGGLARNQALGAGVLDPWWLSGGGGLTSTVGDYFRFTELVRGRGEAFGTRLLGDRTFGFVARNHLPGNADLRAFGRPLFAESPFDGVGFGLGFSVLLDPVATHTLGSPGELAWGGAASTAFWVDPVEDLSVVFMTQLLPSSTYPLRSRLRQLVYAALVDSPSS